MLTAAQGANLKENTTALQLFDILLPVHSLYSED